MGVYMKIDNMKYDSPIWEYLNLLALLMFTGINPILTFVKYLIWLSQFLLENPKWSE